MTLLEHHIRTFTTQDFIDDPSLFIRVETQWRNKQWSLLLGELPTGAVLARIPDEGGVVFHYKVPAPE